jgi:phytoene dehydrogenase-like protein
VIAALPSYRSLDHIAAERLGFDPLTPSAMIAPTVAEMHRGYELAAAGGIAERPGLFANLPSVVDPTMAPADGRHVFSLETLFTPYGLPGGWPGSSEPATMDPGLRHARPAGFLDGPRRLAGDDARSIRVRVPPPLRPRHELRRRPARRVALVAAGADSLSHAGARALPHRRGDIPGAGIWGAMWSELCAHRPAATARDKRT